MLKGGLRKGLWQTQRFFLYPRIPYEMLLKFYVKAANLLEAYFR